VTLIETAPGIGALAAGMFSAAANLPSQRPWNGFGTIGCPATELRYSFGVPKFGCGVSSAFGVAPGLRLATDEGGG
jgi:hypothetical protein